MVSAWEAGVVTAMAGVGLAGGVLAGVGTTDAAATDDGVVCSTIVYVLYMTAVSFTTSAISLEKASSFLIPGIRVLAPPLFPLTIANSCPLSSTSHHPFSTSFFN